MWGERVHKICRGKIILLQSCEYHKFTLCSWHRINQAFKTEPNRTLESITLSISLESVGQVQEWENGTDGIDLIGDSKDITEQIVSL